MRGVRFTSVLGLVLLGGITVLFVTGLLSYAAYNPDLAAVNDKTPEKGLLGFYLFAWPTGPHWLYRVTQGVHVTLGIVLVPVLLAKLWSVIPRLFALPRPVGGAGAGAGVAVAAGGRGTVPVRHRAARHPAGVPVPGLVLRAALLRGVGVHGRVRRARRPAAAEDGTGAAARGRARRAGRTGRARPGRGDRVAARGAGRGGGYSLLLLVTSVGRSFDGTWRRVALLTPRGGAEPGGGPNGFQINKTARKAGIVAADTGERWRLTLASPAGRLRLSRAQLLALEQHTAALPIACVEGWSTADQHWRGVRLRDLAALAGYEDGSGPPPPSWSNRSRSAARSGPWPCATTRSPTRAPCSPSPSTARTSPPTTAFRHG
ncbi:hypothetical protein ACFQVA_23440 [Actinomadura keratinilytica]